MRNRYSIQKVENIDQQGISIEFEESTGHEDLTVKGRRERISFCHKIIHEKLISLPDSDKTVSCGPEIPEINSRKHIQILPKSEKYSHAERA